MDAALAKRRRDFSRHVVRTLDQVGDNDEVADALPTIGAEVALQHHALRVVVMCDSLPPHFGNSYVGR
jgi:hypothetical protein